MQIALAIWSVARFLRATGGLYESQLFYGMILLGRKDINGDSQDSFLIPMMLIVVFLVIEIGPFMFVLDWHFMQVFLMKAFPENLTEPLYHQLAEQTIQENHQSFNQFHNQD